MPRHHGLWQPQTAGMGVARVRKPAIYCALLYSGNPESENAPERNLNPELIAVRNDVIETAKRNLSRTSGNALENEYRIKAREYGKKFSISPGLIEDWIGETKNGFRPVEAQNQWDDSLPLPPQFLMP